MGDENNYAFINKEEDSDYTEGPYTVTNNEIPIKEDDESNYIEEEIIMKNMTNLKISMGILGIIVIGIIYKCYKK